MRIFIFISVLVAAAAAQQRGEVAVAAEAGPTTTAVPILKDERRVDPVTGAFIYHYMGGDGSGKFEVRFPNGTVIGNFTFVNDQGEQETRWYSAGERGTEISGDGVISPAPPTLVDETTGKNYVDLSNYDLYRHLEEPYVHQAGEQAPDAVGRSRVALDHGDVVAFAAAQAPRPQPARAASQPARPAPQPVPVPQPVPQSRGPRPVPRPAQPASTHFNARNLDHSNPDALLDSLIGQFQ